MENRAGKRQLKGPRIRVIAGWPRFDVQAEAGLPSPALVIEPCTNRGQPAITLSIITGSTPRL